MSEEIERLSSRDNFWCYSYEIAVKGYVAHSSNNRNFELRFALAECRRQSVDLFSMSLMTPNELWTFTRLDLYWVTGSPTIVMYMWHGYGVRMIEIQ